MELHVRIIDVSFLSQNDKWANKSPSFQDSRAEKAAVQTLPPFSFFLSLRVSNLNFCICPLVYLAMIYLLFFHEFCLFETHTRVSHNSTRAGAMKSWPHCSGLGHKAIPGGGPLHANSASRGKPAFRSTFRTEMYVFPIIPLSSHRNSSFESKC